MGVKGLNHDNHARKFKNSVVHCFVHTKKKVISKASMEVMTSNATVYILNFLSLVFILFKFFYLVNL